MTERKALAQRILEHYDAMPRGERRLADLLLEHGASIRNDSATALAASAGVSKATATRFFQRLGYASFKVARSDSRAQARRVEPSATVPAERGEAWQRISLSAHLDRDVQNLIRTIEQQRSDDLAQTIRLLARAEKIWVVGFGDNYPLAHFARALLIKLRPDIRMIPIGGFPVPEEFASISASDTMLAFGFGRRGRTLRNLLVSAKGSGASVILLTDGVRHGDGALSSVTLHCRSVGAAMFDSMTATVSLLTYLCASLAAQIGEPAIDRLRFIESIHAEWGDPMSARM